MTRKTELLVRVDHVAIGDAVHVGNDVYNLFDGVGAADVVLHEDREIVAVACGDRLAPFPVAQTETRDIAYSLNRIGPLSGQGLS